MEWPTDILVQFLKALAVQADIKAQHAWHQLAFLVCKRDGGLAKRARKMPRPILLRIEVTYLWNLTFQIPFMQATVVCVDIDWGDGRVDKLREKGAGYIEHMYSAQGEYAVRIFPADEEPTSATEEVAWLDHLGFERHLQRKDTKTWWRPLREIVSLGHCGLRSLSYLFTNSDVMAVDLRLLRVGEIRDMSGMFSYSEFNQPIGGWDVSNVSDMSGMFYCCGEFNQPIGGWNVSNVTNMDRMFFMTKAFNHPIGDWSVGNVKVMSSMFHAALAFNQPIGSWDVSNVKVMSSMFHAAVAFNQPIGSWDVSNVTDMSSMFCEADAFNQPIGEWNVSNVTDMSSMFCDAKVFNQPLSNWNVSHVTNMIEMFYGATAFNQPIGNWNVSSVTSMEYIFDKAAAFKQPLSNLKLLETTEPDQ